MAREGSFVQVATIDDIEAAFNDFGDSGLKAYIDAQDDAHQAAAVTAANGYTDAASNTLSAAIVDVDNKFANYYDKDDIAALGYATVE